jgi:hypothetical protein
MLGTGEDPKHAIERERIEHQRKQKNSFAQVAEDFIRREVVNRRRGADMERELRREFIARWGTRSVAEVKQHDVLTVLDEVVERGSPSQARALFAHVRRLYNWAVGQGRYGLTSSPCDRLRLKDLVGQRNLRTRVLGDDELRLLWRARPAWLPVRTLLSTASIDWLAPERGGGRTLARVRSQQGPLDHSG